MKFYIIENFLPLKVYYSFKKKKKKKNHREHPLQRSLSYDLELGL